MISFIVPVYNKGNVIFTRLTSLMRQLKGIGIDDYEIIVVNDGSTDDSFNEALRFKKYNGNSYKVRIFHYGNNIGKGFALKFGFEKSKGDPVVFLDGDMDIDTKQIIKALNIYWLVRPDMVIGSKYLSKSRIYYPFNRYLYSVILKGVIRFMFNLSVSDTQVGLKVFRREVLAAVFPKLIIKRFAVDLELLVVAGILGYKYIKEIPVIIKHTSANKSSIDAFAVKDFCQDIAAIWYRKNILRYYQNQADSNLPSFSIQNA